MADRSSDVHCAAATHDRTHHTRTLDLANRKDKQDQDRYRIRFEVAVSLCQSRPVLPALAQIPDIDITASLYLPLCDCSSFKTLSLPRSHYFPM
jgi:hypothetical protein